MSYSLNIKLKAIQMRKNGYSIKEIAKIFQISQCTSSMWCSGIVLSAKAQERLFKRKILGQYKAIQTMKHKIDEVEKIRVEKVRKLLSKVELTRELKQICCALL